MNTMDYFRHYTNRDGEERGDPFEGVAAIFQPSRLSEISWRGVQISPQDLAAPILVQDEGVLCSSIYCMYSLNTRGRDTVSADTLAEFKKTLQIHESNFGLGSHVALLLDTLKFQERVSAAIDKAGLGMAMGLVDYFDETTFHGWFDRQRIPFQKRKRFELQREYRIVIPRNQKIEGPHVLEIGDLSDITLLVTPQEFNEKLELRLPDGSSA